MKLSEFEQQFKEISNKDKIVNVYISKYYYITADEYSHNLYGSYNSINLILFNLIIAFINIRKIKKLL